MTYMSYDVYAIFMVIAKCYLAYTVVTFTFFSEIDGAYALHESPSNLSSEIHL